MRHTALLGDLAATLFEASEMQQLASLVEDSGDGQYPFEAVLEFDRLLGGPGIWNIDKSLPVGEGETGRYEIEDRDVFRPLQYCKQYFSLRDAKTIAWLTREIVHMSALHLECLVKKIAVIGPFPLGRLLREPMIGRKVGPDTWARIDAFTKVYNAAKHDMGHTKDTHLFSPGDAILAYFCARRLAAPLFPHARLATPWATWRR